MQPSCNHLVNIMQPSCNLHATIMQPPCHYHATTPTPVPMLRWHIRRPRRHRAGARMPVLSPAHALTRKENIGLDLTDGRKRDRSRSVIRGMRILHTTSNLIFLLPPTHPSESCGSSVHARAWSWGWASPRANHKGFQQSWIRSEVVTAT